MRFLIFFILLSGFSSICSFTILAQIVIEENGKKIPLENMILEVKQLDEFISRFNYQADFFGKPVSESFKKQFTRSAYINFLFNLEDKRLLQNSKDYSESYVNRKNKFIKDISGDKDKFIDPLSKEIYAIANCRIFYRNKPEIVNIILRRYIGADYVKWVIHSVDTRFLDLKNEKTELVTLPPNSHETNFISLKKAFDKKINLTNIASEKFVYDQLSVLFFLVSNDFIQFQHVEHLKFRICDFDNWSLIIDNFNRDSQNAGWLISDLEYIK
jgi:hypothetical protein